jgi:undecaprenyl-diphosphatase
MTWEKHLEHWLVVRRTASLDWFFIGLSWIGRLGLVWIAIALVVALVWRKPGILLLTVGAAAAGEVLSDLGKAIVPRHRSFETQLGPASTTHSFPSGHALSSFACATVLGIYLPRWRPFFFGLAALIALSRVYNGMHYPTDVLAGALLGIATGWSLVYVARHPTVRALRPLGAIRRRSLRAPR